jgi:CRISPR type III-A-associated RAMP protein Csm5
MTNSFLKPYTLVVQTLCPLHIGTGIKLGKADFIVQGGRVHVIDENKLMAWIIGQLDAEKLALWLADDLRGPVGIDKFMRDRFRGNLAEVTAYSLVYQGAPKDIATFIKTTDHHPYLPGSSVKGSLRSALLRGKMLGDNSLRQKATQAIAQGAADRRKPRTNSDQIQANLFVKGDVKSSKWPNYDINRLLLVRDSEPLDVNTTLEIGRVKVISVQTNQSLQEKNYDIFVEVIKARQLFQHAVTWQTNLLKEQAKALGFQDLEDLMVYLPEYCRRVSENLLTQECDFYRRHGHHELMEWFEKRLISLGKSELEVFILPVGWGSGYDAKSITDLLGTKTLKKVVDIHKNTRGLGYPGNRPGPQWLGWNEDAPKSRKVVVRPDGTLEPMGWVAMRFTPADSLDDWLASRREALMEYRPVIKIVEQPAPAQFEEPPKAPTSSSVVPRLAKPPQKPLIKVFIDTPNPGDGFEGVIFGIEEETILLEIPGLDPDTQAYAMLARQDNPLLGKVREGQSLRCQVFVVEEDTAKKGCYRVRCQVF